MPTASRNVRKLRRIKRERSLAYKMATFALRQRDEARAIAAALEQELQRRDREVAQSESSNKVEVTKVEDETDSIETAKELSGRDE